MGDVAILDRIYNDSLRIIHASIVRVLILVSLWLWNISRDKLIQVIFFEDEGDPVLPSMKVISASKIVLEMRMVSHLFKMRT